jgi:hypothetical protein
MSYTEARGHAHSSSLRESGREEERGREGERGRGYKNERGREWHGEAGRGKERRNEKEDEIIYTEKERGR